MTPRPFLNHCSCHLVQLCLPLCFNMSLHIFPSAELHFYPLILLLETNMPEPKLCHTYSFTSFIVCIWLMSVLAATFLRMALVLTASQACVWVFSAVCQPAWETGCTGFIFTTLSNLSCLLCWFCMKRQKYARRTIEELQSHHRLRCLLYRQDQMASRYSALQQLFFQGPRKLCHFVK